MSAIKLVVAACLAAPALGLLMFGPRPGEELPRGRVVVDYWEKWTGTEESQMRQVVNDFNNTVGRDKGIFVRYVSTSNVNQKTLIATAAGVPPDVAGLFDANLVQFAAQDALEPLDDLARAHGLIAAAYKPVYWDACNYEGRLWGLVSTPAVVALHYNKRFFRENAAALRAAGLDPDRPPRTIDELDAYAHVLTTTDAAGRIVRAGYLPTEPGWYLNDTCYWFGGDLWDGRAHRFTLTDPHVVRAYEWVQSYFKRLGKDACNEFHSGLGNFDSPQNSFLAGVVAMEQQGPWMANYIYNLSPSMSTLLWSRDEEMTKSPAERLRNYDWAAAPFPSAVGESDVSYCPFDVLVIPRGSKHKPEAFEFIAFVNRQDVMEKLCRLHCKNSPLAAVSADFLDHHPNPYIRMFERLAGSPNAHAEAKVPIMPEVRDELTTMTERLALLQVEPEAALRETQDRLQAKYDRFMELQRARRAGGEKQPNTDGRP